MNTKTTKELGEVWKVLNEKYDAFLLEIIDSPEPVTLTPERVEELKSLQKELFELEGELLNSCKGE